MSQILLPDTATEFFSSNFTEAREASLLQLQQYQQQTCDHHWAGVESASFAHPLHGPDGELLATDVAFFGDRDAPRVIVLNSATHGVEGYAGNAIQRYLLTVMAQPGFHPPRDCALIMIHAINPWGMAWKRRCDEQGIDLNRNFVNFDQALPANPGYELVRPRLFTPDRQQRREGLAELANTLGQQLYEVAISGGQYGDPAGPFYGGSQPAHGNRVINRIIEDYQLAQRQLVFIDLHTGLGPWSYGELICDHPAGSACERFAQKLFSHAVTNPERGTSSSVAKSGLLDYRWHEIMGDNSCFLTLEFGSFTTEQLFDVIIDDHSLWENKQPSAAAIATQQQAMMAHFCPADFYWRQSVLVKAWQVMQQLIRW